MTDEQLKKRERDLSEIRDLMMNSVASVPAHGGMKKLLRDVAASPGKMLRTQLMLAVAGDRSGAHRDELFSTAAAMELIHNSSLILDDMIDDSPLRRGKLSVQKKYGKPIALCSGVYQLISALNWLSGKGFGDSVTDLMDAVQVTCDGEMLQHENRGNTEITEEMYFSAIRGKTAYVFQIACRMGCRITGREPGERKALEEFGLKIGTMFQLRDDLLDWTMEEAELGKPVNEDFAEGVYTLPAVYTFSRPGYGEQLRDIAGKIMIRGSAGVSRGNEGLSVPSGKDKIPEAGGSEDAESRIRKEAVPFHGATSGESAFTPEDLAETRRIVREAGGIDYTLSVMKKLGDQANELLDPLPEDPRIGELRSVVSFLLKK